MPTRQKNRARKPDPQALPTGVNELLDFISALARNCDLAVANLQETTTTPQNKEPCS